MEKVQSGNPTAKKGIQSPLVIVYLVVVESLDLVDMFSSQIVYFSMYFSGNRVFSLNSGHFEAVEGIHYYKRQLYYQQKS